MFHYDNPLNSTVSRGTRPKLTHGWAKMSLFQQQWVNENKNHQKYQYIIFKNILHCGWMADASWSLSGVCGGAVWRTEVLISLVGWDTHLLAIGIPPEFYTLVSFEYRCRYIGDLLRITSCSVGTTATTRRLTTKSPSSNGVITSTRRMVASLIQIIRSFVAERLKQVN